MKIERIQIRGYRSLYDVTFEPHAFTVLFGPNGAGKSNVVDALDFLADVHIHGLLTAIDRKGGFDGLAYRRSKRARQIVLFQVEARVSLEELRRPVPGQDNGHGPAEGLGPSRSPELLFRHGFSFESKGPLESRDLARLDEKIELSIAADGHVLPYLRIDRDLKGATSALTKPDGIDDDMWHTLSWPFGESLMEGLLQVSAKLPDLLTKGNLFNTVIDHFTTSLAKTRIYRLNPMTCRLPATPSAYADLTQHGYGLPAVVSLMKEQDPRSWWHVLEMMGQILPGIDDVRVTFTHDGKLTLEFVESNPSRSWSITEVSDGTIQSLALFTALYDRRTPLRVIEEPEHSLHSWVVRSVVDACRAVTSGDGAMQVVLTTHSPVLVDYLFPDDVFLVWRDKHGHTVVRPLTMVDQKVKALWEDGKIDLFGQLDSGLLRQAIPGGVQ